jgi:hypothetical protein
MPIFALFLAAATAKKDHYLKCTLNRYVFAAVRTWYWPTWIIMQSRRHVNIVDIDDESGRRLEKSCPYGMVFYDKHMSAIKCFVTITYTLAEERLPVLFAA